jgi:CRISPR/Cas system-associated exonuclease Cas4 (RecB family)
MEKFLQSIVDDIAIESISNIHSNCYVFPTKRACLIFKHLLRQKFKDYAFWSPSIKSIEEFVQTLSGGIPADELTLLFEMYWLYKKYEPDLQFDRFYPWGQVLLKDFDEVDKYLVNAKSLYQNILLLREIEAEFELNSEAIEAVKRFRKIINATERNKIIEAFIEEWKLVGIIYFEFKDLLRKKGLSYPGMLYRELAEDTGKALKSNFAHIYFCGFNALSIAEEEIFDYFLKSSKATAYWDADLLYLNDSKLEAGSFLRRYKNKWKGNESRWIVSDFRNNQKKISFVGASKAIAQAKVGCSVLSELLSTGVELNEDTALVLADENLLFPVLYSLPVQKNGVNITMGYPLKKSAYLELIESLFNLYITKRKSGDNSFFKTAALINLINNPYFVVENKFQIISYYNNLHFSWVKFSEVKEKISNAGGAKLIAELTHPLQLLEALQDYLLFLFDYFNKNFKEEEGKNEQAQEHLNFEKEVVFHLVKYCKSFKERVEDYRLELNFIIMKKIMKAALQNLKIPFTGEPLKGLQVMGLLETRTLDFDRLIVLSVNEGNIPEARSINSYIPYSLRKAYQLPTFEVQDSIYAYHFFRLLQRAKEITLIYNTEMEADNSGEKSRFLLQLAYLISSQPTSIEVNDYIYSVQKSEAIKRNNSLQVLKSSEVLKSLNRYNWADNEIIPIAFSPTALTSYIHCSMQFYFRYVAGLKEQEEYNEELNALEFGKVLHRAIELIYQPYVGNVINPVTIQNILASPKIDEVLQQSLAEEKFVNENIQLEGKNLLLIKVIRRLLKKILEADLKTGPLKIIALEANSYEREFEIRGRTIKVGGTIDRIDEIQEPSPFLRIIDYKTGKVENKSKSKLERQGLEEYFKEYFKDSKLKASFQAYYYAYLYVSKYKDYLIRPGIFGLKEVNKGVQYLQKFNFFDDQAFDEFEAQLVNVLKEIFDPEISFKQTDDKKKCNSCAYREICN